MTNIYSIIESFGRQFWVEPKKFQDVSNFKINPNKNNLNSKEFRTVYSHNPDNCKTIFFDKLMLVNNQSDLILGKPFLNTFRVEGSILPGLRKKSKLMVFKMRAKKRFRRRIGFKLSLRRIRFENILQIKTSKLQSNLEVLVPNGKIK